MSGASNANSISKATTMPLARAAFLATSLVSFLRDSCVRIEIGGSIRRERPEVGDIEIIAQPLYRTGNVEGELFPTKRSINMLDERLEQLMRRDVLRAHPTEMKWGEKYRKLWQPDAQVQIDLFIVTPPAEWGPALVVRTGPAEFSKEMVTELRCRNLRCDQLRILNADGETVTCPDEQTFFFLCGRAYLPPDRRF